MERPVASVQQTPAALIDSQLRKAYELRIADLRQSVQLTQDVLSRCEETRFEAGIAQAKAQLGLFHLIKGEFQKAIRFSEDALQYYQSQNDPAGQADAKYNIGSVYYRTNKYHQGLLYLLECLQLYRQIEDYPKQARTLKSIATIYEYFNDYEKAIEAYEKSIEAGRMVHDLSIESNALNPLSGIYAKQGLIALAYETVERSIALKKETGDVRGLSYALYGRAKISIRQGNFKEAVTDLEESAAIFTREGDQMGLGMVYNKMGLAFSEAGNYSRANHFFLQALDVAEKCNVQWIKFKANFNLYQLAKREGNAIKALDYLEQYFLQKELVINNETYSIIKSYDAISKIEALEREALSQKERNEIIEKKNAELDSFFYRVSHDLKGPISSLLGLDAVVNMEIKDEKSLRLFAMFHSQVTRMNDIVMGLITLTEINNKEKLKTRINFEKLVDECVDSCRYLPNFISVRIEKDIQEFDFQSEWTIINTILQNLIENGIKYSRNNTESYLRVRVYSEESEVVMIVEDNGQGIPESHQNNIFNMFYRANERAQGSGLGLYILKRAVERLSGSIEFTSVLNAGSRFVVKIPV